MSDLDLDRLGDVWRQQPEPAELAELQRAADTARNRAQWGQRIDTIAALAVATGVTLLVLRNPQIDTLLVGGGAILLLLVSQIRQRRLRAAELKSLTGTSEDMVDQSILRVTQRLKRSRFGLIFAAPGILTGMLLGHVVERNSRGELGAFFAAHGLSSAVKLFAILALVAAILLVYRQYRHSQRELERLLALREAYRQENESSMVNELPPGV